jgi:uncharacterized protein YdhG (YjbR/CyaY superfamily)
MKPTSRTPVTIDDYIADFPKDVQRILGRVRATIRRAAPGTREAIRYGIPTFRGNGNVVHFAAYQAHIGLYPAPRGNPEFGKELSAYEGGKGTVRFPLDAPIPYGLIARIVKLRARQDREKASSGAGRK